jgi:hypothetical protein
VLVGAGQTAIGGETVLAELANAGAVRQSEIAGQSALIKG